MAMSLDYFAFCNISMSNIHSHRNIIKT